MRVVLALPLLAASLILSTLAHFRILHETDATASLADAFVGVPLLLAVVELELSIVVGIVVITTLWFVLVGASILTAVGIARTASYVRL